MRYEIDENNYITAVYFNCNSGNCTGYTGNIPEGYTSLEDWASNATIEAYFLSNGNLTYDSVREAELQAKWAEESQNNQPGGGTGITLLDVYPVGSIYMSVNDISPSMLFGGTWETWGTGRVPVGIDTSQTEFNTVEKTGGEKTHILTVQEMPSHAHVQNMGESSAVAGSGNKHNDVIVDGEYPTGERTRTYQQITDSRGGDQPHNNLQPYITCYMWKRTA